MDIVRHEEIAMRVLDTNFKHFLALCIVRSRLSAAVVIRQNIQLIEEALEIPPEQLAVVRRYTRPTKTTTASPSGQQEGDGQRTDVLP